MFWMRTRSPRAKTKRALAGDTAGRASSVVMKLTSRDHSVSGQNDHVAARLDKHSIGAAHRNHRGAVLVADDRGVSHAVSPYSLKACPSTMHSAGDRDRFNELPSVASRTTMRLPRTYLLRSTIRSGSLTGRIPRRV